MTTLFRTLIAGTALTLTAGTAALAEDCTVEPSFVGVSSRNSDVRASYTRLNREDWRVAAHFAREALESRTSARNKAAASVNLCWALAGQGSANAVAACDDAVERNPEGWQAYNNRGAAYFFAGNQDAAAEDFARAVELGGDFAANPALASCSG